MTFAEVMREAKKLPREERESLVQALIDTLETEELVPAIDVPAFEDLAGFAKPEGPMLTDEDIECILMERLEEKYLR